MATGSLAWWVSLNYSWYWWIPTFCLHGICYNYMINGFHEIVHSSVFRTQPLKRLSHIPSYVQPER